VPPTSNNLWLQVRSRLLGGLYGAIFGLAGGTIIDWILLLRPKYASLLDLFSVTDPLPGAVVGVLVGVATSSVGTLRRMLWGALIGLSIGAALRALLLAQMDGSDPAPWYSFENRALRVGVLWAAFAGPTFAWVAALAGALVSPPPWEAAELESLNGPCWRWRWTRARRDLLLYGMARAARTGMLIWTVSGALMPPLILITGWWQGYLVGVWFGFLPLSLIGIGILRDPSRFDALEGLGWGALAGVMSAAGILWYLCWGATGRPVGPTEINTAWLFILLVVLAFFAGIGMMAGFVVADDLEAASRKAVEQRAGD